MLAQHHVVGRQVAPVAMHRQVKGRIVVLNGHEALPHLDAAVQFLTDFAPQRLLRRLASLNLAARKLPAATQIAIATLRGQDLAVVTDDGGNHLHNFQ